MYYDEFDNQLLNKIKNTDWRQYKGPRNYSPRKIFPAFEDLVLLREEKNKWKVSSDLKFALGNDQGNTYYPALLSALPLLIDMAINSRHEPVRNCTLEVLCDWSSSFEAELGSYTGIKAEELNVFVSRSIRAFAGQHNENESERNLLLVEDIRAYLAR
jgi:hypothetical protein